jgi:hypothetical protein
MFGVMEMVPAAHFKTLQKIFDIELYQAEIGFPVYF